jgi:hypothetical protein
VDLGGRILEGPANDVFVSDLMTGKHFYCLGLSKIKFLSVLLPLSEGSLIIVNKVKSRKQIGKNFCSFLFMLNFGNQFPFRILFRILSVIVNCNFTLSFPLWLHGQLSLRRGLNLEKSTHYLSIYLQRIKKPKGRHMRRRGDRGGPLIENGRTK